MHKKGFTLIELLAVIVILGIILAIAVPNIINLINNAKNDAYLRQNDLILDAAGKYVLQNEKNITWTNDTATIYLRDLQNNNLLDNPLKDPRGGQYNNTIPNGTRITVTRNNNRYTYSLVAVSGNDTTIPVIALNGAASIYINFGSTYNDAGATASDNIDGNITNDIVVTNNVNTSVAGTYTVIYNVTDKSGNKATTVTRTVNVMFMTFTFTNAGQTGALGPSQAQIDSAYTGTSLAGKVTVTGGIQSWIVPYTGTYRIETYGAQGGGVNGGKGARIIGDFTLTQDTILKILVGQQGGYVAPWLWAAGGGGGTYVVKKDDASTYVMTNGTKVTPLIIAGGGGGSYNSNPTAADANIGTDGKGGSGYSYSAGATDGNSGSSGSSYGGYSGGGFLVDTNSGQLGRSFLSRGSGGTSSANGGFGGGGGASNDEGYDSINNRYKERCGASGGGGYSGGGYAYGYAIDSVPSSGSGGGGGSYNIGSNPSNTAGIKTGHGQVIINYIP